LDSVKFLCCEPRNLAYTEGNFMAPQEPIRKRPPGPAREIPDKLYFRIGEVAKLCEVPAYVLRFWEGEFPQLKPNKGGTGQRLYRRRDVEMALRIKSLLYDEGYTIPGARQAFKAELRSSREPQMGLGGIAESVDAKHLEAIRKELRDIHALLSKPAASRQSVHPIRGSRSKEPAAAPPPTPFPKPKLLQTPKAAPDVKDTSSDTFVNGLFDDLPPLK
jgi:DNA-binding transcriptional MerR regulator